MAYSLTETGFAEIVSDDLPILYTGIVTLLLSTRQWQNDLRDQIHRKLVYRPLQFQKRRQLFIGTHNVTLSVVAMRVSNPDPLFRAGFTETAFVSYFMPIPVKRETNGHLRRFLPITGPQKV